MQQAAEQGLVDAQYQLAKIYREGKVVPRDMEKALLWYGKVANQNGRNAPPAHFALGLAYFEGQGIDKDLRTALFWLTLAGENDISAEAFRKQAQAQLPPADVARVNAEVARWKAAPADAKANPRF